MPNPIPGLDRMPAKLRKNSPGGYGWEVWHPDFSPKMGYLGQEEVRIPLPARLREVFMDRVIPALVLPGSSDADKLRTGKEGASREVGGAPCGCITWVWNRVLFGF